MSAEALHVEGVRPDRVATEAWWAFPAVPFLGAAACFGWILYAELQRAYGMTALAWDLAYQQQVVWNVSRGHGFYSSFARADLLGIHLEPILIPVAAVERLWPSPIVLLILGSAALAATGASLTDMSADEVAQGVVRMAAASALARESEELAIEGLELGLEGIGEVEDAVALE